MVMLCLNNVCWCEVFDMLFDMYGFVMFWCGNVIWVMLVVELVVCECECFDMYVWVVDFELLVSCIFMLYYLCV